MKSAEEVLREGNIAIANYMNETEREADFVNTKEENKGNYHYHRAWVWLMPVVEKIMQHRYEDGDNAHFRTFGQWHEETQTYMVRINRCGLFQHQKLITAIWMAVVDFITYSKC